MIFLGLREIKTKVDNLADIINAENMDLPAYGKTRDVGPHIEVDSLGYHYVLAEKGDELSRETTTEIQELLFLVFDSITSGMSFSYELKNRIQTQDSRRIAFHKKIELLDKLNPEWAKRAKKKIDEILCKYPYDDNAGLRADYCGKLREKGISENIIYRLAYEKYP